MSEEQNEKELEHEIMTPPEVYDYEEQAAALADKYQRPIKFFNIWAPHQWQNLKFIQAFAIIDDTDLIEIYLHAQWGRMRTIRYGRKIGPNISVQLNTSSGGIGVPFKKFDGGPINIDCLQPPYKTRHFIDTRISGAFEKTTSIGLTTSQLSWWYC